VVVICWMSSTIRTEIGVATIAIIVTCVAILAAFVSTGCGVATSVAAAMSLNFFHTEPFGSFRIGSWADVTMILILGFVGLAASALARRDFRELVRRASRTAGSTTNTPWRDCLDRDQPLARVFTQSLATATNQMLGVSVRLVVGRPTELPLITRPVETPTTRDHVVELPRSGGRAEFSDPRVGYSLIFRPDEAFHSREISRRLLFDFVDLMETAILAGTGQGATEGDMM
jgi:hypothetical protein